ncbi:MAG: hypothetical protein WA209_02410, partial [Candidatus Acidiferrales bacterium]
SEVVEADFESESVEAPVDASAAFFFELDFLVEAVEESVADAVEDFEAAESLSAAGLVFFDFEVEAEADFESDVEPALSAEASAAFFLLFEVVLFEAPLALESPAELASEDVDFFFFLLLEAVLSVLESLDELLADELDCAFADRAPMEIEARIRAAHASAM